MLIKPHMIGSPQPGRAFSFDQQANGYVVGEGCLTVVLKPYAEKALPEIQLPCFKRSSNRAVLLEVGVKPRGPQPAGFAFLGQTPKSM